MSFHQLWHKAACASSCFLFSCQTVRAESELNNASTLPKCSYYSLHALALRAAVTCNILCKQQSEFKITGWLRSSRECLIDNSKATEVPQGALFIYRESSELFQQINKSWCEWTPATPAVYFISTRRPPLTKMFPREPKLWQSQRFELWQFHCYCTTKSVDALLKFAERLQKQLPEDTSGQGQERTD